MAFKVKSNLFKQVKLQNDIAVNENNVRTKVGLVAMI